MPDYPNQMAVGELIRATKSLRRISSPPLGHEVTEIKYVRDAEGKMTEMQFYENSQLLFKLIFSYDAQGYLISVKREES